MLWLVRRSSSRNGHHLWVGEPISRRPRLRVTPLRPYARQPTHHPRTCQCRRGMHHQTGPPEPPARGYNRNRFTRFYAAPLVLRCLSGTRDVERYRREVYDNGTLLAEADWQVPLGIHRIRPAEVVSRNAFSLGTCQWRSTDCGHEFRTMNRRPQFRPVEVARWVRLHTPTWNPPTLSPQTQPSLRTAPPNAMNHF